jgi:hypothetical protein
VRQAVEHSHVGPAAGTRSCDEVARASRGSSDRVASGTGDIYAAAAVAQCDSARQVSANLAALHQVARSPDEVHDLRRFGLHPIAHLE